MKKLIIKSIIVTLIILIAGYIVYSFNKAQQPATTQAIEQPTLQLSPNLKTIEGKELGQLLENKIVLINFWASWCAPCVEEFASMIKLTELNSDIVIVAISEDSNQGDIDEFLKTQKYKPNNNFLIIFDQDMSLSNTYNVQKLPESIIFNKNKQFVKKVIGSLDWASEDAQLFFKELK